MCKEAIKNEQKLWFELTSNPEGDYIKNISDFKSYMEKDKNPLNRLSKEDLQKFMSDLTFAELNISEETSSQNFKIQKVSAINWEIPVTKYDFTVKELEEVAGKFGISALHLWSTYHHFGQTYPPNTCEYRPYWNCPY